MWAAWCREGRSGRPAQTAVMVPAAANDYGGPVGGTRLVAGSSPAQRSAVGRANALEPSSFVAVLVRERRVGEALGA